MLHGVAVVLYHSTSYVGGHSIHEGVLIATIDHWRYLFQLLYLKSDTYFYNTLKEPFHASIKKNVFVSCLLCMHNTLAQVLLY